MHNEPYMACLPTWQALYVNRSKDNVIRFAEGMGIKYEIEVQRG